jgi:outer membrane immunogenic protein
MQVRWLSHYALAAILNVVATAASMAGEIPLPAALPPDVPVDIWWRAPPARFSWTGCHLGAHIGGAFGEDKFSGLAAAPVPVPPLNIVVHQPAPNPPLISIQNQAIPGFPVNGNSVSLGESGMLGGVQGGCDLQVTPYWVIGIDADASGGNVSGSISQSQSNAFIGFPAPVTTTVNSSGTLSVRTNFLSTVTARTGWSIERGRGLIYVKGGAAFATNNYTFGGQIVTTSCNTFVADATTGLGTCAGFNPPQTSFFSFNGSESRVGWTAGIGLEWAVLDNWSVKLEYDYLDFGSRSVPLTGWAPAFSNFSMNQRINEVKLGVNYLFGFGW